jgi:predicted DNA-binding protein YlxM (UPF0122 family)
MTTIADLQYREIIEGVKRRLTKEQQQAIIIFYRYNIDIELVAEFFSMSVNSVYYHYKRCKLMDILQDKKLTPQEALQKEGYI